MSQYSYLFKQAYTSLKRSPGFVFSVVSTMGITLGALLCVLTLAYVMIFKPLPYPNQDQLYRVDSQQFDASGALNVTAFSYPSLMHLYKNQQVFEKAALSIYADEVLTSSSKQPTVSTAYVSPEWFELTGAKMALGRSFSDGEQVNSHIPVAVLSYQTWVSHFAKSADILNQKVTFRGISFQVVGVLSNTYIEPKISSIGRETKVWLAFDFNASNEAFRNRWWARANNLTFIGKLGLEETVEQAQATLTRLVNDTWQENIDQNGFNKDWHIKVALLPFKTVILGESEQSTYLLLAGVLGLLAIAFINIANLQLSRTVDKKKQLAVRASVGARGKDLFTMLFTESLLLMLAALLFSLLTAYLGFEVLRANLMQVLPRVNEISLGFFTLYCALLTAVSLALLFALVSYRTIDLARLNQSMKTSGKGTGGQVSKKVLKSLVVSQVTVATVLIFMNLNLLKNSLDIIFDPSVMKVAQLSSAVLTQSDGRMLSAVERSAITAEIQQNIAQLPQVSLVSRNSSPLTDGEGTWSLTEITSNQNVLPLGKGIDSHYFSLMKQRILHGNNFNESHFVDRAPVLIINEQLAQQLVNNEQGELKQALGKHLSFGGPQAFTVIGIVNDYKLPGSTMIPPRVYIPNGNNANLLIQLKPNQELSRADLMAVIQSTSQSISLFSSSTLVEQKAKRLFSQYTIVTTTIGLTVITFILAAIGLYGILSYSTKMRRFEIATRMAVGAKRVDVIKLIFKDNSSAILLGMVFSVAVLLLLTIGFSERINSYLAFESVAVFIVTLATVCALSLVACYLPLRQYFSNPVIHALKNNE